MSTKRTSASEPAPVTGVAAGSLGTAANLDETQVLRMEELEATSIARAEVDPARAEVDSGPAELELVPTPLPAATAPPREHEVPAARATPTRPSWTRRSEPSKPGDRRRSLALAGMGALATLIVLAGAGIVSQLDFGAIGAEPSVPALGVKTESPATLPPQPKEEAQKGKGNCNGHGKHCRGSGED